MKITIITLILGISLAGCSITKNSNSKSTKKAVKIKSYKPGEQYKKRRYYIW